MMWLVVVESIVGFVLIGWHLHQSRADHRASLAKIEREHQDDLRQLAEWRAQMLAMVRSSGSERKTEKEKN